MNEHLKTNREFWDKLTEIHVSSKFYDVEGFKRGRCTLNPTTIEELGDVTGKSLLHLQCHFGMDTLSWARRGAFVTGVDFSEKAIEKARLLSEELDIPARFICSEISELPANLSQQFDIVFTSEGVKAWLPDLKVWAKVIAHFLKPGGTLYIHEFHPFMCVMDDEGGPDDPPRLRYAYFPSPKPMEFPAEDSGDYADPDAKVGKASCEWFHSFSEFINALIEADLRIEFLHEFDWCTYKACGFLRQGDDGLWRYPEAPETLPLMFSLKATRVF
ncbi:MAG: class I SAM-dependent methyltransferase [Candidatus Coatesbacteria bacterium]|nr:class I SAM-dependent methyltransferase [Candidatus Coatesbacteria bacterium]